MASGAETKPARGDVQPPAGVTPYSCVCKVRFSDVDGMRHMNNARYLTFTEEARSRWAHEEVGITDPEAFSFILAHARLDFLAAANLGDEVRVEMWTSRIGTKSWDFAYRMVDADTGTLYCTALTTQVAFDYGAEATIPIPDDILGPVKALA